MKPKGQKRSQPIFHYFTVEDLVPQDHILRMIDKAVDFSFTHKLVEGCYCPDNGRPGVDPEVVVRMILIGYMYNLSIYRYWLARYRSLFQHGNAEHIKYTFK